MEFVYGDNASFTPDWARQDGTLHLGDTDPNNAEIITFRGYGPNTNQCQMMEWAQAFSDLGGVTLRYESTSDVGADKLFSLVWCNGRPPVAFKEGSAGTIFAPAIDNLGFCALGGTTGPVMTITKPASLVTAGTVGFYNSRTDVHSYSESTRGDLGPVVISSTGSFTLQAAGTAEASAFTTDGIMNAQAAGSKFLATTVTVNASGTLKGAGTVDVTSAAANAVDVFGTVSPGNSPGILTIDGNITFESGSQLRIERLGSATPGEDYGVLNVIGGVTFVSGSLLNLSQSYAPGVESWDIVTATGGVSGWENLSLLPKYVLELNGNTLTLSHIPEPASLSIVALAGLAAIGCRRRR